MKTRSLHRLYLSIETKSIFLKWNCENEYASLEMIILFSASLV